MASRPKPWHQLAHLKDELRTGELTLAEFAADLHEVALARGRHAIYEDPQRFFSLTYPTLPLRDLVKDVAERLAGKSNKAVRQLELTYGGGKTHTLITLYHLFGKEAQALPDVGAVRDFREHMGGGEFPKARVATLCFDKIDVEKGIAGVRAPDGEQRTLRHPWSVLAFQLAGADGLRSIHGEGKDEERETPPAEPLLAALLEAPNDQGLATLVLVDEVLTYARQRVAGSESWQGRIVDFFQYLVQAVIKVDRAAMVASLLASDPAAQAGSLGEALRANISQVFRRQHEEGIQPIEKEDVAEVLRRRFFDDLPDQESYRSHVIRIVGGLDRLEEDPARSRTEEESRFLASFPFHPDLTEVFYSRWTQIDGFQRTRGMLRTMAMALRDAEGWDPSPVVGPAALLTQDGTGTSAAMRELAGVVDAAATESTSQWSNLVEAELDKAQQVQQEVPILAEQREVEQAVITTFLHSQPIGGKANTSDLLRTIGSGVPDPIELDKGLRRWRDVSWFLDDADAADGEGGSKLPRSWRLGKRPNLRHMHDEARRERVTEDDVKSRLQVEIGKAKGELDGGARAAGADVHTLPGSPKDVGDDGAFRYVILGPQGVSDSGKPSPTACRYINETTGPNRPRVNRNAVVVAVPSRDGLANMEEAVRTLLAWEDVNRQLDNQSVDPLQGQRLRMQLTDARKRVPDAVRQGYATVVTVNEDNQIHAFKLAPSAGPLFPEIKNDQRSRIQETPVDAEALLPEGPYDLWREGEDAHFVKDLAGAFARDPRLPKFLTPKTILDTILQGVERGLLVARQARPDGSARTWWNCRVDQEATASQELEVVLPNKAELGDLPQELLAPEVLPDLWQGSKLPVASLASYFSGSHQAKIPQESYDDYLQVPKCPEQALLAATKAAVTQGNVWLVNGPTSMWKEEASADMLEGGELRPPPEPIPASELTEDALPGAWN
ncbi:MAG: ATP-binding protein, partial [Gammaproteobacteria bacterium]|nr:ATP-binding protein [Gammaproteobacteria bacterium]